MRGSAERKLVVFDLHQQRYHPVWDFQRRLHALRYEQKIPDTLVLVEHTPVYTIGKNGSELHVVATREVLQKEGIEVVHTDRGGDVTYHGPGQLVGYPIFDLHQHRTSVSWYMRSLEEVFIRVLAHWGILAERLEGYTGVWIKGEKILALGVRISKWITMHGFALNVNTDLRFYEGIIPCGIFHRGITSLQLLLGEMVDMQLVKDVVIQEFQNVFVFADVVCKLDLEELNRLNSEDDVLALLLDFQRSTG